MDGLYENQAWGLRRLSYLVPFHFEKKPDFILKEGQERLSPWSYVAKVRDLEESLDDEAEIVDQGGCIIERRDHRSPGSSIFGEIQ